MKKTDSTHLHQVVNIVALVPLLLAVLAVRFYVIWLAAAVPLTIFLTVALMPAARNHQAIWIFLLTAVSTIPLNYVAARKIFFRTNWYLWQHGITLDDGGVLYFLCLVTLASLLLLIEEVIFQVLARVIWQEEKISPIL